MHAPTLTVALIASLFFRLAAAQTSSTIPGSPEEALRLLRHTQGAESDWSTFADFTSVAMKNRVRAGKGQPVETDVAIFLKRESNGSAKLMVIAGGRSDDISASFDRPALDASKAKFVRDETIPAAGRTYSTKVYTFDIEAKTSEGVFMTRHQYWLAAGVPGGVVRHESIGAESGELLKPGGSSVTVLSELDVPFTIRANRFESCSSTRAKLCPEW